MQVAYSFGAECAIVSLFRGTTQLHKMWHELSTTAAADIGHPVMVETKLDCNNNCSPLDLLFMFAQSSRRCMDPTDYVYGVLGLLQMDIPRMNDPHAVWTYFLSQVEDLVASSSHDHHHRHHCSGIHTTTITLSERAKKFDLSKADNMADVYGGLLYVEYASSSSLQDT